jgi:hypothetical protein
VFGAADTAVQVATFVGWTMREFGRLPGLPSADEVVSQCLAALPSHPGAVRLLGPDRDLRSLTLDEMRVSRQAKNVINAAVAYLDALQDPALIERLREWLAVRYQLV